LGNVGGRGLSPLPGTLVEVEKIQEMFPEKKVLKENDFIKEKVRGNWRERM